MLIHFYSYKMASTELANFSGIPMSSLMNSSEFSRDELIHYLLCVDFLLIQLKKYCQENMVTLSLRDI